ncbi:hypothetical protein XcodCFBP4690_17895 [Xanthomonas codiaei]|uniref:Uncharacterized protein n=1 Tax=Xanthomonas codiaei TaxID=56463 RepID=A0A2S7CFF2_9XANT|nr:hypothetical protein XcodCFBP4690_17895 [Xanthomonas codiaei]
MASVREWGVACAPLLLVKARSWPICRACLVASHRMAGDATGHALRSGCAPGCGTPSLQHCDRSDALPPGDVIITLHHLGPHHTH